MRAKVRTAFHGLADNKTEPEDFEAGKEVEGNLAWYAVQSGFAEWIVQPNAAEAHAMRTSPVPAIAPQPIVKLGGEGDDGGGKGESGKGNSKGGKGEGAKLV